MKSKIRDLEAFFNNIVSKNIDDELPGKGEQDEWTKEYENKESLSKSIEFNESIIFTSGDIISMEMYSGGYGGGAHCYHNLHCYNIWVKELKVLRLSDLFLKNSRYMDFLAPYCIHELVEQENGCVSENISLPEDKFVNFKISDDGIYFVWGEYEVAPYACGPYFSVFVSYNKLKEFIDTKGPLKKVIKAYERKKKQKKPNEPMH